MLGIVNTVLVYVLAGVQDAVSTLTHDERKANFFLEFADDSGKYHSFRCSGAVLKMLMTGLNLCHQEDLDAQRKISSDEYNKYWKEYRRCVDLEAEMEQLKRELRSYKVKENPLPMIEEFLEKKEKILAIKHVREVVACELKEAKDMVDNWNTQVNWGHSDPRAYSQYPSGSAAWPQNTTGKEVFVWLLAGKTHTPEDESTLLPGEVPEGFELTGKSSEYKGLTDDLQR